MKDHFSISSIVLWEIISTGRSQSDTTAPYLRRRQNHGNLKILDGSVTACIGLKNGSTVKGNLFILDDC